MHGPGLDYPWYNVYSRLEFKNCFPEQVIGGEVFCSGPSPAWLGHGVALDMGVVVKLLQQRQVSKRAVPHLSHVRPSSGKELHVSVQVNKNILYEKVGGI